MILIYGIMYIFIFLEDEVYYIVLIFNFIIVCFIVVSYGFEVYIIIDVLKRIYILIFDLFN